MTAIRTWVLSTCGGAERERWRKGGDGSTRSSGGEGNGWSSWPVGEKGGRGNAGVRGSRGEPGLLGPPAGGAVYTRWGRTTCPTDQGTQLLYAGRAGAAHWQHKGGATNYLCLPSNPDYLQYESGVQGFGLISGVEYWYAGFQTLSSLNNHNVPCAVCYVTTRSVLVMIPAKTQCPTDWTLEYVGYVMSGYNTNHEGRNMYECVDNDPESIPGLNDHRNPAGFLELVEPHCNGFSCPLYDEEKELTCVVCTR